MRIIGLSLIVASVTIITAQAQSETERNLFGGSLQPVNIEGWEFTRYVVSGLGPMGGTLMAVDPEVPKVDRFITLAGEPQLMRYQSRLPLVAYGPDGVEARYRIWRAGPEAKTVPQG